MIKLITLKFNFHFDVQALPLVSYIDGSFLLTAFVMDGLGNTLVYI